MYSEINLRKDKFKEDKKEENKKTNESNTSNFRSKFYELIEEAKSPLIQFRV